MKKNLVLIVAPLVLGLLLAAPASGFMEDICFSKIPGPPSNCVSIPPECQPTGTETDACRKATANSVRPQTEGARSTVHADTTHLMAQLIGFSADDAYWIAAYNDMMDYGVFEAHDLQGNVVGGG